MKGKILLVLFLFISILCLTSCKFTGKQDDMKLLDLMKSIKDKEMIIYRIVRSITMDRDVIEIFMGIKKLKLEEYTVAGMRLKSLYEKKEASYGVDIHLPVETFFYLSPFTLWLKVHAPMGEDIVLDDMGYKREIIRTLFEEQRVYEGYEVIDNRLSYIVLAPIWGEKGEYLGAVEVRAEAVSLMNYALMEYIYPYLLLVDKKFEGELKDRTAVSDFIIYYDTINMEEKDLKKIFERIKRGEKYIKFEKGTIVWIELRDMKKNKIGYMIILVK